jgi:hypothetical protein
MLVMKKGSLSGAFCFGGIGEKRAVRGPAIGATN